jgi:hypothetical protein
VVRLTTRFGVPTSGTLAALLATLVACGSSERGESSSSSGGGGAGGPSGSSGGGSSGASGAGGANGGSAGRATGGRSGNPSGGASGSASGGGGSGGAGAGGEGGSPEPDTLDTLVDAFCSAARNCCGIAGEPVEALAACEDQFRGAIDTIALVEGGTISLNQAALSECIEAYERARTSCTLTEVLATCRGIFVGTVADNRACTNVMECDRASGPKVCLKIQGAQDPNVGTCLTPPRGTNGTPCLVSCEEGEECSSTASAPDADLPMAFCHEEDGLFCAIGESCAPIVADGEYCQWHEACGSDGFCLSTCESSSQAGESCQFNYGCEAGYACIEGECAPEPLANGYVCTGQPPSFT